MDIQKQEQSMSMWIMVTLFVVALWLALWSLTGSGLFVLFGMITPPVALAWLALKTGHSKRNDIRN